MSKGNKPLAVAREQNVSVTVWDNEKKSGDGTYRTVTIDVSRPTVETKDLPKEQREYKHAKVTLQYKQLEIVAKLLAKVKEEVQE